MPISPSPSYHKYDITDYCDIDKAYGSLDDFKQLIEECNKRGIKVIIDLVMNHSSIGHPWFKEAREYLQNLPDDKEPDASECKYVNYYTFKKASRLVIIIRQELQHIIMREYSHSRCQT